MRLIFRLIVLFFILLLLAGAGALWFGLSNSPLIVNSVQLSHQDIARAQVLLRENDPRRLPAGTNHSLQMSEADLNLAGNYLLQKLPGAGFLITLKEKQLNLQFTLGLPYGRYLNIDAIVHQLSQDFDIQQLRIGKIALPQALARRLVPMVLSLIDHYPQVQLTRKMLDNMSIELQAGEVQLTYLWDPSLFDSMQSTLLTRLDRNAVAAYYQRLLELQKSGIARNGSLTTFLQPLFALAAERSSSNDPVLENAALLSLLGAWALGSDLRRLLPEAGERPYRFRLKLQRRIDFAQHFLGSAAIAAQSDSLLADAIGTYKEVADTDYGSGFSFTDLAADRAGVKFGELASRSEEDARRVQRFVAAGIEEPDIMPRARDLPEYLRTREFKRRFGEVGSDAYNELLAEIERRINACRIYRM